jgi:hypothetical protein
MTYVADVLTVVAVLGSLGYGAVALFRWARRTGRRPWLWLVGAYVAANILWAVFSPFIAQP